MNRLIVLLVTIAAVGIFAYTLVRAVYFVPGEQQLVPTTTPLQVASAPAEAPLRLRIPSLSIDAAVQQVGVNGKGNMGVPTNFIDVAWYKFGTTPGQAGSAVIDGHVDNGLALSGVFKHLTEIHVNDDVYVDTKEGHTLHFRVEQIASYPLTDVPLNTLFNRSDAARLNLITCSGAWVSNQKTYDQRLVVYTVLVP